MLSFAIMLKDLRNIYNSTTMLVKYDFKSNNNSVLIKQRFNKKYILLKVCISSLNLETSESIYVLWLNIWIVFIYIILITRERERERERERTWKLVKIRYYREFYQKASNGNDLILSNQISFFIIIYFNIHNKCIFHK